MTGASFDGLTRHLGRRQALQALGLTAVTTASGVSLAGAKKNGKNNGQKNRKQKQKLQRRIERESLALCAGQVNECVPLLTANCNNPECVALGQTCCQELADCDFQGLVTCITQPSNT